MKILATPLTYAVHNEGDNPVFGESATHVSVDDDAGGRFIVLKQDYEPHGEQILRFDLDELIAVTEAAKKLIGEQP